MPCPRAVAVQERRHGVEDNQLHLRQTPQRAIQQGQAARREQQVSPRSRRAGIIGAGVGIGTGKSFQEMNPPQVGPVLEKPRHDGILRVSSFFDLMHAKARRSLMKRSLKTGDWRQPWSPF